LLRESLAVYDVIYNPRETRLLKEAKATGAKTANGLSMLLFQGAAAFELMDWQTNAHRKSQSNDRKNVKNN
jgi:shikimate 5-dehydrogenase